MNAAGDNLQETIVVGPSTIEAVFIRRPPDAGGVRSESRDAYGYTAAANVLTMRGICGAFQGTLDVPYQSSITDGGATILELLIQDTLATFTKL
jgi:hypothetical protein